MARVVTSNACGRMTRSTVRISSFAGLKSVLVEPAFSACPCPGLSFGSSVEVFGKDNTYQSGDGHSSRRATGARATLMLDHFATLGIRQNASKSEIKTAYKTLAKQYHPDVCLGDQCQTKFIQITSAYEHALNCITASNYASSNWGAENYAEDCREELEDWEDWMGWEGAGSHLHDSADFPSSEHLR